VSAGYIFFVPFFEIILIIIAGVSILVLMLNVFVWGYILITENQKFRVSRTYQLIRTMAYVFLIVATIILLCSYESFIMSELNYLTLFVFCLPYLILMVSEFLLFFRYLDKKDF